MAFKIYLYDTEDDCIGSGALSSSQIQLQLDAAGGQDVEVHISSVGGSAFDAIATYDLIKKYPGNVITYIDALAASAASIVAMAGGTVCMSKYALLMIHKPAVGSQGNADDLMADVNLLNVVQSRLAAIYMAKTGLDEDTINSLINAVTWLTAEQALDLGFIDKIDDYNADNTVTNKSIIKNYAGSAPLVYQRVINKMLKNETTNIMNPENKEFIEKTTSVLDKITNFFKKITNKSVTNSGDIYHVGALAVGVQVFNDADMEDVANDGDIDFEDQTITIKDGVIENIKNKEADPEENEDPDEDDDEIEVNGETIKLKDKEAVKAAFAKITSAANKEITDRDELLLEATATIQSNLAEMQKTETEIKKTIKSSFTLKGSSRANKSTASAEPVFEPESDVAKHAVKIALRNKGIK